MWVVFAKKNYLYSTILKRKQRGKGEEGSQSINVGGFCNNKKKKRREKKRRRVS